MAKALVKDYGLLESEIRETNFNRFMSHIGEFRMDEQQLRTYRWMVNAPSYIGIQFSLVAIPFSKQDD